jgi:hypothetical protein
LRYQKRYICKSIQKQWPHNRRIPRHSIKWRPIIIIYNVKGFRLSATTQTAFNFHNLKEMVLEFFIRQYVISSLANVLVQFRIYK